MLSSALRPGGLSDKPGQLDMKLQHHPAVFTAQGSFRHRRCNGYLGIRRGRHCFSRSRHTNNAGNQLQLSLMTRSALVERLQQHGRRLTRRVNSRSPTWVFPPYICPDIIVVGVYFFFSSAYLKREDDIFKLAKVAVVVNLQRLFFFF